MHKNATKCNKTQSNWCINKHGSSKIIDTFETYQTAKHRRCIPTPRRTPKADAVSSPRIRAGGAPDPPPQPLEPSLWLTARVAAPRTADAAQERRHNTTPSSLGARLAPHRAQLAIPATKARGRCNQRRPPMPSLSPHPLRALPAPPRKPGPSPPGPGQRQRRRGSQQRDRPGGASRASPVSLPLEQRGGWETDSEISM
jgi:hypothetical protein